MSRPVKKFENKTVNTNEIFQSLKFHDYIESYEYTHTHAHFLKLFFHGEFFKFRQWNKAKILVSCKWINCERIWWNFKNSLHAWWSLCFTFSYTITLFYSFSSWNLQVFLNTWFMHSENILTNLFTVKDNFKKRVLILTAIDTESGGYSLANTVKVESKELVTTSNTTPNTTILINL